MKRITLIVFTIVVITGLLVNCGSVSKKKYTILADKDNWVENLSEKCTQEAAGRGIIKNNNLNGFKKSAKGVVEIFYDSINANDDDTTISTAKILSRACPKTISSVFNILLKIRKGSARFVNNNQNYLIIMPKNWKYKINKDGSMFNSADEKSRTTLDILSMPISSDSLELYKNHFEKNIKKRNSGMKILKQRKVKISNTDGYLFHVSMKRKDENLKGMFLFIHHNGKRYTLQALTDVENYEKMNEMMEIIIMSIRFL